MNLKKILNFVLSLLIVSQLVSYGGQPVFTPLAGARTVSLNGMYFGGVDGIGNILSNPAGLSALKGKSLEFSVFGRLGQQEYIRSYDEVFRSFRDDDVGIDFGFYWNIFENASIGLNYNTSMQYRVNWPFVQFLQNDSGSVALAFDHINEFNINNINPAFSYDFGSFRLGLTANIYQVKHQLGFYQGNETWGEGGGEALAAYQFTYEQDAWAYGLTLGFQTNLSEDLRIGVVINSAVSASLEGDAKSRMFGDLDSAATETTVSSEFELPWRFGVGGIYNLTDNLMLNVDMRYSLWGSTQESMLFEFGDQVWNEGLNEVDSLSGYTGNSIALKFNNSFDVGFGLEYLTDSNIRVRFGYKYSRTPNSDQTYSMLFPAVDQHWVSVGIGFRFEQLYIDAALAYGRGLETEISKDKNFFYHGKYNGDTYLPTINVKYEL